MKQFGERFTFFCQFKSLLAPEPFAILQKIRYRDLFVEFYLLYHNLVCFVNYASAPDMLI